jgi:hypothetical protein
MKDLIGLKPMDQMIEFMKKELETFGRDDRPAENKLLPNSGIMVRHMTVYAGDIIVGEVHNEWNTNILASGSMLVTDDPTGEFALIHAPTVFETGPNSQKFGMAVTDCIFMNVIKTKENETVDECFNRLIKDK